MVAIKQLDTWAAEPRYRAALLREAQVMADLTHPHVVTVFDFVERDGLLLLAMEQLDGGSLAEAHERCEVDAPTACGYSWIATDG